MMPHNAYCAAVRAGDTRRVEALLPGDPNLIHTTDDGGGALHYAAILNHRDLVDLLLRHGADLEELDARHHVAPIGWANEKGHSGMVAYLLSRGARVQLHQAVTFGLLERVRALVHANPVEVNTLRGYGRPVHFAAPFARQRRRPRAAQ